VNTGAHRTTHEVTSSERIMVDAMTLAELVRAHGEAFYMKIDIEGMDRAALRSFASTGNRPYYLSMETTFGRERSYQAIIEIRGAGAISVITGSESSISSESPRRLRRCRPVRCVRRPYLRQRVKRPFRRGSPRRLADEGGGSDSFPVSGSENLAPKLLHRHSRLYANYCGMVRRATGSYPNHAWFDIHAKHVDVC